LFALPQRRSHDRTAGPGGENVLAEHPIDVMVTATDLAAAQRFHCDGVGLDILIESDASPDSRGRRRSRHDSVTRRVKTGHEAGCEEFLEGIIAATGRCPGHLPLITLVVLVIGPWIKGLALVPRLGITTAVTVPIMTWIVMPRVTHLLRGWLYPRS
jgi:hypothetical protein